ncbi:hypothetical protein [Rickettsia prowazekii]|uniref:Uncharacterized protein n=1 Tax=Rickettsia prowazekii (strain Rp22) TaxID=449216 RepID=D5AWB6_RICPP|nr:hypothetical protein [Rickettsia prowazekii]ADE29705.1 hypothetical protein rpr22_0205 [Rickettsia prowazekii str. Rp22]
MILILLKQTGFKILCHFLLMLHLVNLKTIAKELEYWLLPITKANLIKLIVRPMWLQYKF